MKVAVYGVALNEEANVRGWVEAAEEADYILLADTGSTDNTAAIAQELGIRVIDIRIVPFRFDDARIATLAALPLDLDWCISLDLDDRLQPGWRQALEEVPDYITKVGFWYTSDWYEDGTPETQYWRDRCHRRTGFTWKHHVHEAPVNYGHKSSAVMNVPDFKVLQFADSSKERDNKYVDMLRRETFEEPKSLWASERLAWTLRIVGREKESATELRRYLADVAVTAPDRAYAMYWLSVLEPEEELYWLERAAETVPECRQHILRVAIYHFRREAWEACLCWVESTLAITDRIDLEENEEWAWGSTIHTIHYITLFRLGRVTEAIAAAEQAQILEPENEQIARDIKQMQSELTGVTQ